MSKPIEEQSNTKVAKSVTTPKRRYFAPLQGQTVEAMDVADATAQVTKIKKDEEVGDVNI